VAELEEGLQNAVIAGVIWHKEINIYNDDNLAADYYLTDGSDSIVVKAFWDKSDDDKIQVGDVIKAKGSIRFARRLKEPALFMERYCQLEKDIRSDDSAVKRIELHAHTKMSAMDGLTEVKELVSRAAQWRHPAIAITDHACIQAFPAAYAAVKEINRNQDDDYRLKIIYGVEAYLVEEDKKERPHHIILLARTHAGLKNLYQLVSISYLDHFYRQPRIPRQELLKHRDGLLLGTACEAGELFQALLRGAENEELARIVNFYDYLEIQPRSNNIFLIRKGLLESELALETINRNIVALGREYGKLVVATGDVHFLDPDHEKYRTIIKSGQDYEDAEEPMPLYFRTTAEMLEEFSYLGTAEAERVVIEDPIRIASLVEGIKPVPDGFYPPKIDSAEQEITELTWQNAHAVYGPELPPMVEERIRRELASIIDHGFSVLYLIAHKLVKKSNEDGYLVGSRGSVGSSLVAFLTGITEVNALPPHYICRHCYYSEFVGNESLGCGVDLEDQPCPCCGQKLFKDGFNIPFETFMGFEGDKVPDIDLNFSGDYQSRAHQYVEELFGSQNVFRAGTISTIADKTAFGFVKKYAEKKGLDIKNSEMIRLARGITGVRRTTGQHPGGLIVVPTDKDIMDFTPLQHPADNKASGVITTHFEYHAIGDQLVKLDILGHDDPTVIKELEDLTGIKASGISLSEAETMKLFSGVEPLGVRPQDIDSTVGTYGIPEFGTPFVRQMLEATRPTTFAELVRISGLSHGTDVWLNNAQRLIADQVATLNEVICTRDDIMTYLIQKDMNKIQAFEIMEKVRKGKGLNGEDIKVMEKSQIPSWYIAACQKIKYMFPKAHAVAYVTMAYRIAWFKINYPLPFYASFFGIRAEDFDADTILGGYELVRKRIKEIEKMGHDASPKDKKLVTILELAMEMYARGFYFKPVDIYKSEAHKFIVADGGLILPFAALPNIGAAAAQGIISSRTESQYISVEDFQARTRLNKSGMDMLRKENCFAGLPEKSQISLFA
jgi:DNA polymerase-3 subunit alpha (Gram-positive type)